VLAVDLKKRLDVSTDTREPEFGQIYYDYHMGHHFSALNAVIQDKNKGLFTDDDAETESLLGDLYTEFGLPREADAALSRVQSQDIPSSTRNMPWLRYGKFLISSGQRCSYRKLFTQTTCQPNQLSRVRASSYFSQCLNS
jgi:hypothetical protein